VVGGTRTAVHMIFLYSSDNPVLSGVFLVLFFLSYAAPEWGLKFQHLLAFLASFLGVAVGWALVVWVMDGIPPPQYMARLLRQAQRWLGQGREAEGGGSGMDAEAVGRIATRILEMPTEGWVPPNELDVLSVSEVKERLRVRGVESRGCSEKQELVSLLRSHHTSSESLCPICFDHYAEGDCVRLLPKCKHIFHLECIDRWAYAAASKSRTSEGALRIPACPLCNTSL